MNYYIVRRPLWIEGECVIPEQVKQLEVGRLINEEGFCVIDARGVVASISADTRRCVDDAINKMMLA